MDNSVIFFIILLLIGILGTRVIMLEMYINKHFKGANIHTFFGLYHALYDTLFSCGVLEPRSDYVGYRCDLILEMFYNDIPEAEGVIEIDLEYIRPHDHYYKGET